MNILKLPQLALATDAGSKKFATFRINIKQNQISDVSSGHTKAEVAKREGQNFNLF
jgi:hypothetical protein